ncbi:hypothetical protein COEREDRAFT_82368 [Coemansia reversa NRRL 1564]|uniref:Exportin-4 n=1 Tax=Coemansia reversa (strain ATCC 12441 / NRRL 1564) TaxID=763665 RepID=A0A2G5B7F9_COERN|nr:hypothetical protein COEREDRAFT_82368 [Coemansia reversa NRRL 1564]|eukprot:PIA14945.1 hypothetical protein COEREDRAFT_82368 [Coemansia reversa NRRL 1564]
MDYSQVLADLEQACADFQVPATRFAAEQQLQGFGKRPDAIDAGKFALVNSNVPTAKFFALRGIKEAVITGYAVLGLTSTLALRDELFQLALAHNRKYDSFVLDSLCWVIAVITKRAWTETAEEQKLGFTQTLYDDIVQHSTPCIGMIVATYLIDEISGGSKCSEFSLPWEFHYSCKATFENTHMLRLFEAALKVIHQQLRRSMEEQRMSSGGSHIIAYERRSALHIAERVLNWEFTSPDESKIIAASFGNPRTSTTRRNAAYANDSLDEDEETGTEIFKNELNSRTPLFPRDWQLLLLNGDVISMFFSVYEATLSDQMHTYFSPGSSHIALQCLVQISGIRGKAIFNSTETKNSDVLRAEFARFVMCNQLQVIRHVCSMDLTSEASEDIVIATTQMIRRFIETQLEELPLATDKGRPMHPLAFLVSSVPETLEYFGEVSKFICMLLSAASGILRSDRLQRIDDEFGDVDNYFIMQAFDELANAWSAVINDIREWQYLDEAASTTQNSADKNQAQLESRIGITDALSSFVQFLTTTACLIRTEYLQLRMLVCEDSIRTGTLQCDSSSIDQGLFTKDYVVYEDQLQFYALLARLDFRTSMDCLYENLCCRCNALQEEIRRLADGGNEGALASFNTGHNQHTIDLLHEQTQWIVLMIGYTLCDSGTSERVLIPRPVLEYSASTPGGEQDLVVQSIMTLLRSLEFELASPTSALAAYGSPLFVETLFWTLKRVAPVYFLFDRTDYRELSQSIVAAFGSKDDGGNGAAMIGGVLDMIRRAFDMWSSEEDVLLMCVSMLLALAQRSAIAREIALSPQFTPLMSYFTSNMGKFPEAVHGAIIEALALLACHLSPAEHERCFSELKSLIAHSFSKVVHSNDFMAQHQNALLVNQLLDGLDMMDGLLSAANFRNMDAVFGLFFELVPLFEQLLVVYVGGYGISRKVVQVVESAARYLEVSSLPDDEHMLRFSHCFREILHRYHSTNQGRTASQADDDLESQSETTALISAMTYLVRNEMGFSSDETSHSMSKTVSDAFGETEVFGVYCIQVTANAAELLTPNVLRMYVQFLSEMVQYRTPSLLRWLPADAWKQVMSIFAVGIDNDIYDVSQRTYEAIGKLGAFVKINGLGDASSELHTVFGQGIKQLLSKLLRTLLFSPFDVELVESAGTALVTLGLIDPVHLQSCFHELFLQGQSLTFSDRLAATLAKFNADLDACDAVKTFLGSVGPTPRPIDSAALRQPLFEFLVNTRAVLRVK